MSDLLAERRSTPPSPVAIPARLCWEAAQLCRSMDVAAEQLQHALTEAAEHANAVIEIALLLDQETRSGKGRSVRATPTNH